jgi:hypothetical protein
MKQIRASHNTRLEISDKASIDTIEVRNLAGEARRNKSEVLEGALTVENFLSKIISHFFFSQNDDKKATFDEMVINSDWCSFAAKRKLLNYIINKENLLQGSEKEKFEKSLQKVMSLRNAFAHGKLSSDGKAIWLSYFEGKPHKKKLTDQYLSEVESELNSAWNCCVALAQKTGAFSVGAGVKRFIFQIQFHSVAKKSFARRICQNNSRRKFFH